MTSSSQGERAGRAAQPVYRSPALTALLAAYLAMFLGSGVTILYSSSVIIPGIALDTGWPRADIAAAVAPAALAIGLMCPVVGGLTDKFGPRTILIPASMLYALSLAMIPALASTPVGFAVALTIAAAFSAAITPVTYSYLIIGWMPARRGLGMGIILAASGLGVAVVPTLIGLLLPILGWRTIYILLGAASLAVILPMTWWCIVDPPRAPKPGQHRELMPISPEVGMSLGAAVKLPAFWTIAVGFLLNGIAANAGSISLPLLAADHGISPRVAATVMVWVGLSMVASRIAVGALLDRFSPIVLTAIIFAAPALAFAVLLADLGYPGLMAAAVLFGIAIGTGGDAMAVILSQRFGMRHFGRIFGVNFAAYAFSGGLGPWILYTLRGNIDSGAAVFVGIAGLSVLAATLVASNRTTSLNFR